MLERRGVDANTVRGREDRRSRRPGAVLVRVLAPTSGGGYSSLARDHDRYPRYLQNRGRFVTETRRTVQQRSILRRASQCADMAKALSCFDYIFKPSFFRDLKMSSFLYLWDTVPSRIYIKHLFVRDIK